MTFIARSAMHRNILSKLLGKNTRVLGKIRINCIEGLGRGDVHLNNTFDMGDLWGGGGGGFSLK